ncbi:hypothetical protein BS78_05G092900 [Paspalum vaginatum]|nr:hypothetical protein BS78_05G092900 [Paspalum vaginatum]
MDAHHVLDGMLPPGKRVREAPPVSGSIDSLPDEALQHILGFMVAPEAVRTSVLARRWRHLWKFATDLRLGYLGDEEAAVKAHREFVDHLLLLRGGSPLDTCEFRFTEFDGDDAPRVTSGSGTLYRANRGRSGLVSLRLDEPCGMTPVLDSVPSLLEAFFETVDDDSFMGGDICDRRMDNLDCCCRLCDSSDITVSGRRSVLLEGLSQAKSLVLISGPNQIIIKSDLRWCPMFGKLKTLLLNDCWCEPDDFDALACILEHSPVLEKLTLELFDLGPKFKVEMKGSFNLMARSDKISEHLSIVKVKCQDVGDKVLKVLKFLGTFNIGTFWQSPCFSFKRVENILKHVFCVDCLSYFNRFLFAHF